MSRCFPFPPPGYEKKFKADDPGLLKKEQLTDKNIKRDKKEKDKEKKESKEKREKKRSDEKRKEKKDKKEKHRDKKEKERDPNKDEHKGNGLYPDERAVGPPDVHSRFHEKSKDREHDGSATFGEKRAAGQSAFNKRESVSKNNHLASQTKIFKNATTLGTRHTDEQREIINQLPCRNVSPESLKDGTARIPGTGAIPLVDGKEKIIRKPALVEKKDVLSFVGEAKLSGNGLGRNVIGPIKLPERSQGSLMDGREKKDKQSIDGRVDRQAVSREARSGGTVLPPNTVGMVQNRVGAMARPLESKLEHKMERDKVREKEGDYQKDEKKRKDDDREKPTHKVKDKKMEKKAGEKVNAANEQKKHVLIPSQKDGAENRLPTPSANNESRMDLSAPLSDGIQSIPKTISQGDATLLGKRKDIGLNGIYDERMTGLNKLAKTTASTHSLTENVRGLDPCQNSAAIAARPPMNIKAERTFAPDGTQQPPTNIKVDGSETEPVPMTQSSHKTSKRQRKTEVSEKLPHSDTKYLSQVLSVPKLDEWPEFDDQEWLFGSNSFQRKKPQGETCGVEEGQKVWASGLWLEPVDVFALPYVIPY